MSILLSHRPNGQSAASRGTSSLSNFADGQVKQIPAMVPSPLFEPARPRLELNALGAVRLRTSRDRPKGQVESMWLCY